MDRCRDVACYVLCRRCRSTKSYEVSLARARRSKLRLYLHSVLSPPPDYCKPRVAASSMFEAETVAHSRRLDQCLRRALTDSGHRDFGARHRRAQKGTAFLRTARRPRVACRAMKDDSLLSLSGTPEALPVVGR